MSPGGEPTSRDTECFSMYSDMSIRTMASSSPNRNSARVRASSVFPTPEGPRKMNEPVGRLGSLRPARDRRALGGLTGAPLLLHLALLVGELALLVAQVGGLLELLRFDRRLLLAAGLLRLPFSIAGDPRAGPPP